MEKLRVAHVITQLELGGAQRNTLYTVGHLNRTAFDTTLICGKGGLLDPEAERGDWKTFFIPSLVRPVRPDQDLLAFIALYKHFRQHKPHILHTHSSKAGILARLAGYFAGVPVIIHTFHGFGFTPRQSSFVRWFYVSLEKLCALLSTHLIFVSKDNQSEAETLGIGRRVPSSLIRSGIAMQTPTPVLTLRQELGLPENAWVVSCVGNFKPQKNPLDLIRVAAAALKENPQIHFLLIGDGELREQAQALAQEAGLTTQIHFLGWREDIPSLLAVSDSFLLTSLWEGLPRALVEAFAAGRPAVAYGVNGVRDILIDGENGFLIPAGDTARAADKVVWLSQHATEAQAMGVRGRDRVLQEFDIDRMVRQQEEVYQAAYEAVPLKDYYQPRWTPEPPKP